MSYPEETVIEGKQESKGRIVRFALLKALEKGTTVKKLFSCKTILRLRTHFAAETSRKDAKTQRFHIL